MPSPTVGEDSRRLAWRCGGRNGRYRGGGGRRALFILLLLLPRLFVLCDRHLCCVSSSVRCCARFEEIRRRKPVYLGFLISSLCTHKKEEEKERPHHRKNVCLFRIVRTRPFCEDQKCLAIARFDYSKMRVYAPRRRALVVPAPESGKPSRGVRI